MYLYTTISIFIKDYVILFFQPQNSQKNYFYMDTTDFL